MVTTDWNEITEEVRKALFRSKQKVRMICEGCGLSPTTINRIKVHGIPLTPPHMVMLADYLGLDLKFGITKRRPK